MLDGRMVASGHRIVVDSVQRDLCLLSDFVLYSAMKKCLLMRVFHLEDMCAEVRPYPAPSELAMKQRKEHGLCQVCNDHAAGTYFGAKVCIPCKAFFIRSTSDKTSVFECPGDQRCKITVMTRTACKFCRFQNCLKAGMARRERCHEDENGRLVCVICGDDANGVHFGALTCEGCKKFYRRGLLVGEAKSYICKADKTCEITARTRNNCRYCRFQKCLRMGMSRDAIQMGRPSRYQRPKVLKNPMTLQAGSALKENSDGESSSSRSSFSATPPSVNASISAYDDGACEDVKPDVSSYNLLHQALEVCHTDVTNLGMSSGRQGNSGIGGTGSSPNLMDSFFNSDALKAELPSMKSLHQNDFIDLTQIENATAEEQTLVDELNAHLPPGFCSTAPFNAPPPEPSRIMAPEAPLYPIEPIYFNWPNRLTPNPHEIAGMFRKSYWEQSSSHFSEQILTEEHQAVIDHLVFYYKQAMHQTELANTTMQKDIEMLWKEPTQLPSPPCSSMKKGIARCVQAAMIFFVNIPGFQSITKQDQLFLVRNCSPQFRIMMAALNWYDYQLGKFSHHFYQYIPPPERLDYCLYEHILEIAQRMQPMKIDSIEEVLLATLTFVASDYVEIENAAAIEEIRKTYLSVLAAYTTAKYGSSNSRFEELLGLIPSLRVIGMEHALVTRGVILGPDRTDLVPAAQAHSSKSFSSYNAPSVNSEHTQADLKNLLGLDMAACL